MQYSVIALLAIAAAAATSVDAHGAIIGAKGINNIEGRAIGIKMTTPRDGTGRNPFQQDASIIRDGEIAEGGSPCGRTLGGGNNDIKTGMSAMKAELGGLPMVAPGQPLTLTVHQINADGAGPYTCDISTTASGTDFQPLQVMQNLPGTRGRNRATNTTPQPLMVMIPQNAQCTGGADGNACIVRCRNPANAGPFGGCIPVMMASVAADNGAGADAGTGAGAGGAGNGLDAATGGNDAATGGNDATGGDINTGAGANVGAGGNASNGNVGAGAGAGGNVRGNVGAGAGNNNANARGNVGNARGNARNNNNNNAGAGAGAANGSVRGNVGAGAGANNGNLRGNGNANAGGRTNGNVATGNNGNTANLRGNVGAGAGAGANAGAGAGANLNNANGIRSTRNQRN
ncbi:hypothetical protein H9P43_002598 [Blastocladiella emersonii ATCC 22665]|nr:hypothetical protein H9P43_002587 [Blastocladiella emersonii ATCC 22665]KAI9188207.1 hypothetical protein H9P43_002598 [Blastocladiella emersonii ATCC 22665]